MSHAPLTRAEAEARAGLLTVAGVRVELDLTDQSVDTFRSRTTIEFASLGPATFVDFQGRKLVAATLNGADLDLTSWQDGRLPLAGLAANNTLVVDGVMGYSSDGEGLHRHVDAEDGETYLYAMSFLDAGPRWFASFDQPDLKAPYELLVSAPPSWTVIGNGPSEQTGPGRWRITPPKPLSTYFVTLVAGPYASVYAEHDGVRLGFHARASLREQLAAEVDDMITVTGESFDYYHRLFRTPYPFGEYHQAFVPDFNAGAMENPGCVTFRDQMIFRGRATSAERARRAGVIAHEMAHMWFGDLVSMRWWDDLWLNESFAEYMANRTCTEVTRYPLWTEFGIIRKDWGAVADQSPSTHPVAGNGAPDSAAALQDFDGISYAKGASVLRQLVAYLGDDVFLAGLRIYFGRFAFGNATFADLMACWTEAGAVGLDAWATSWLRTTGMDTLEVSGQPPLVTISAQRPHPDDPVRQQAVAVGAVDLAGRLIAVTNVQVADPPIAVEVPVDTALVVPDARDETWAKIRFGPDGWGRVAQTLPLIDDAAVLVVIYNALRDAVRDATLDPATALDLVCASVATKSSDVILTYLTTFALDQLAGPYSPPAARAGRRLRVHELARAVLSGSGPGSDRQLTAFRLAVRSSGDSALLRRWLAGDHLPLGLDLDPELRWAIVIRLAACDGDVTVIEAALAADPSTAARVHAARARAALPTPEAKAAAWALLMQPSTASAYELYATGEGFFEPEQTELTAPCAAAYFDEIGQTAEFRSGWVLGEVASRAFPWTSVTAETLEGAERALTGDLAAPVRRAMTDGTDRLRRAQTSLARYPG